MQSVPITTNIVNSNPARGEVYSIQHYVIKFVSDFSLGTPVKFPPPLWHVPDKQAALWHVPGKQAALWHVPGKQAALWHVPDKQAALWHVPGKKAALYKYYFLSLQCCSKPKY
jgi:hypothetical protein